MTLQKTKKQHKKSAAFGGRLLVLCWGLKYKYFLRVQNQICTYWIYLMEQIFLEVQLCIDVSIFNELYECPTNKDLFKLRLVSGLCSFVLCLLCRPWPRCVRLETSSVTNWAALNLNFWFYWKTFGTGSTKLQTYVGNVILGRHMLSSDVLIPSLILMEICSEWKPGILGILENEPFWIPENL